jgi:hypothetical protein
MKSACKTYDEKTISKFIDNELASEKTEAVSKHIETCPVCNSIATKYNHLSDVFVKNTSKQVDTIDKGLIGQNVFKRIKEKENVFFQKVFDYFPPKFYLKIASVVAIVFVSFIYFQERIIKPVDLIGPSAIVNSVDGNVSSVMIFETEKSKQTIIWFSEA